MAKRESRGAIISAARAEFAACGFAGARVDRIARTAGLNKQLIYYYFGSKRALYAAAAGSPPPAPKGPSVDPGTAAEAIRQVVDDLGQTLIRHPEIIALLLDRSATPDGSKAAREWIAHMQQAAARGLSRGQGLGHFRDDLDPARAARAAVVLCLGYLAFAPHLGGGSDDWTSEVRDILMRVAAW